MSPIRAWIGERPSGGLLLVLFETADHLLGGVKTEDGCTPFGKRKGDAAGSGAELQGCAVPGEVGEGGSRGGRIRDAGVHVVVRRPVVRAGGLLVRRFSMISPVALGELWRGCVGSGSGWAALREYAAAERSEAPRQTRGPWRLKVWERVLR